MTDERHIVVVETRYDEFRPVCRECGWAGSYWLREFDAEAEGEEHELGIGAP